MGKATRRVPGWQGHRLHAQWALGHLEIPLTGVLLRDSPHSWLQEPFRVQTSSFHPHNFSAHFLSLSPYSIQVWVGDVFPLGSHGKEVLLSLVMLPQGTTGFFRPKNRKTHWVSLSHLVTFFQWGNEFKETSCLNWGWEGVSKEKEEKENILSVRKTSFTSI